MLPPENEALEIVKYYMFHDIPRLILARDMHGRFWIFDCPFDDELDDYSSFFRVSFAGIDQGVALANIDGWDGGLADLIELSVPVIDLLFDPTKRKTFLLANKAKDRDGGS